MVDDFAQFIDGCERPCDHTETLGFATVAVAQIQFIARVRGQSSCATGHGTGLFAVVGLAALRSFSAFFPHLSSSSGLSRS